MFLLENPKPHKLGCFAGLNTSAGIGNVRDITLILLDVSTARMVKNTQFSCCTGHPAEVDVPDSSLFPSMSCRADVLYTVGEDIVLAKPISFK